MPRSDTAPIYFEWSRVDRAGQAVRVGDWKLIRWLNEAKPNVELFNLADDESETSNVAEAHPDRVVQLTQIMDEQHRPNKHFPLPQVDQ